MRGVSDQYLRALAGSTLTTFRVRPCNPTARDSSGYIAPSTTASLPIIGGTVVQDGTADQRLWTEGLTVAPYWPDSGQDRANSVGLFPTLPIGSSPAATSRPGQPVWPIDHKAPLTPYGKLLLIEAGVEYGNGNVEYARIGYVRIESMDQEDDPDGPITIETRDLSAFLDDAAMVYEANFPANTTMQAVFENLIITNGWRGMPSGFTIGDLDLDPEFAASTLGAARTTEGDRFGFLRDLVTSRGRIWYWDGRGKLVVKPPPDPATAVLELGGPNDKATPLVGTGRSITREGVRNVVVADQSGLTDKPGVRNVQYDGDPNSPTYLFWYGPTVERASSPLITDDITAGAFARTRLANLRGVPDRQRARHTANGAIEPWDVVRLWPRGSTDPGGWRLRQVEATRLPLVPGAPQVTTFRDVRVVA